MKRGFVFSLMFVFVFSLYFVSSSSMSIEFTIGGCDSSRVGTCSVEGRLCTSEGWKDTLNAQGACVGGDGISGNADDCCPAGFSCSGLEGEEVCIEKNYDCENYNNDMEGCEESDECVWFNNQCVDPRYFLSCSEYTNETTCEEDIFRLGERGSGTDVCTRGVTSSGRVVVFGSCRCEWEGVEIDRCKLAYDVSRDQGTGNLDDFTCFKDFNLTECVDGEQIHSWTVSYFDGGNLVTDEVLGEFDCVDGSKSIGCGQPVLKMPGFGFFGFLTASLLISLFYLLRREQDEV
jgi:hypothetical protein